MFSRFPLVQYMLRFPASSDKAKDVDKQLFKLSQSETEAFDISSTDCLTVLKLHSEVRYVQ